MKAITAKEAKKYADMLGLDIDDENTTFFAINEDASEIWEFNSKRKRDEFVYSCNNK